MENTIFETNEGWNIIKSEIKNQNNIYFILSCNSEGNDNREIAFYRDNFLGKKAVFHIILGKNKQSYSEPFKYFSIDIASEIENWFYNDIFLDEVNSRSAPSVIGAFRRKAWLLEGVNSEMSEKIYQKLLKTDDKETHFRYAKFLRKNKTDYSKAIEQFDKAIESNFESAKPFEAEFEKAVSLCKEKKYNEAHSLIEDIFRKINKDHPAYFNWSFYFLVFLRRYFEFDSKEIESYINLKQPNLRDFNEVVKYIMDKSAKDKVSGILLWVDLCGSTEYKLTHVDAWEERMLYFLNMTSILFNNFEYKTIKFIGDEVMLFREFKDKKNEENKNIAAKQIYDVIFDEQRWYSEEINRFNSLLKSDNYEENKNKDGFIKVKICISYIKDATKMYIIRDPAKMYDIRDAVDKSQYDIIGEKVDLSARIKDLAKSDLVVANEDFKNLLEKNGGKYIGVFNEYIWENQFKGFNDDIKYYGRKINN